MKRKILIFCIFLLINNVFSEQLVKKADYFFLIPNYVELSDDYIEPSHPFCITSTSMPSEVFKSESPIYRSDSAQSLMEKDSPVTSKDVIDKLNSDADFVLIDDFRMSGILLETYRKIKLDDIVIGEIAAFGTYDGAIYDETFSYLISLVINNCIHTINLRCISNDENSLDDLKALDDLIYKNYNDWYFFSYEEGKIMHELILTNNTRAPRLFLELNIALRWLLETLEIDGQKIEVVNPYDLSPYSVGIITDDKLRVRTEPLTGDVLGHVNTDDRVIITGKSAEKDTIDNFTDYWYKIIFDNTEGWVYGGYVEVEERDVGFITIN